MTEARPAETATTRTPRSFTASPIPATSPPPESGTITSSTPGSWADDFQAHRPLPFDDVHIVERVYEQDILLCGQLGRPLFRVVVAGTCPHDPRPGRLDGAQLDGIHPVGHAHGCGDPETRRHLGHRPAVVARRGGDHPRPALPRVQFEQPVGRPANLEGSRVLERLELHVDGRRAREVQRHHRRLPRQRADSVQRARDVHGTPFLGRRRLAVSLRPLPAARSLPHGRYEMIRCASISLTTHSPEFRSEVKMWPL